MNVSLYPMLIWTSGILVASLCLVIYLGSSKSSSKLFAFSILWVALWITLVGFFVSTDDPESATLLIRSSYYLGELISLSFLLFFISFPEDRNIKKQTYFILLLFQILLAYLFIFTDKIIAGVIAAPTPTNWIWNFGPFSYIFEFLFFSFFIVGISFLYRKYSSCKNTPLRRNLGFMLFAIMIGTIPPSVICIILPRLNLFTYDAFGPITELIWIPIIAYSIIRYRQMDVRAIFTEVLAVAMTALFFLNIFIDIPFGIYGRIGAFIAFVVLAYILIRSILKESLQREQLRNLNLNLEKIVATQTAEIRRSFEAEKIARLELEKLNEAKDQFIMITQHNLRTPVSSIIWSLESVLEHRDSIVSPQLKPVLVRIYESGKRLRRLVDDFLNITTVKAGMSILNLQRQSLRSSIVDILQELKPIISSMNLTVRWDNGDENWPVLNIDVSKMHEALFIIFENAARYNIPSGSIEIRTCSVNLAKDVKMFQICIESTGIGISPEDLDKIGTSLFYRSEFARKLYPIGMGVGLSVVRAMVHAHQGTFAIKSAGLGKGAQVTITLPLQRQVRPPFN